MGLGDTKPQVTRQTADLPLKDLVVITKQYHSLLDYLYAYVEKLLTLPYVFVIYL